MNSPYAAAQRKPTRPSTAERRTSTAADESLFSGGWRPPILHHAAPPGAAANRPARPRPTTAPASRHGRPPADKMSSIYMHVGGEQEGEKHSAQESSAQESDKVLLPTGALKWTKDGVDESERERLYSVHDKLQKSWLFELVRKRL